MEKNDAFLLFTLAYALDWLIGDPEWAPHPVRWMGRLIQVGENFLRRFIFRVGRRVYTTRSQIK
jgi:cobalamin biosynthesis protein CobD/CbiB